MLRDLMERAIVIHHLRGIDDMFYGSPLDGETATIAEVANLVTTVSDEKLLEWFENQCCLKYR